MSVAESACGRELLWVRGWGLVFVGLHVAPRAPRAQSCLCASFLTTPLHRPPLVTFCAWLTLASHHGSLPGTHPDTAQQVVSPAPHIHPALFFTITVTRTTWCTHPPPHLTRTWLELFHTLLPLLGISIHARTLYRPENSFSIWQVCHLLQGDVPDLPGNVGHGVLLRP